VIKPISNNFRVLSKLLFNTNRLLFDFIIFRVADEKMAGPMEAYFWWVVTIFGVPFQNGVCRLFDSAISGGGTEIVKLI